MKRAAINSYVQVFCTHIISFLWSKYLGAGELGHMVGVCLTFQENTK